MAQTEQLSGLESKDWLMPDDKEGNPASLVVQLRRRAHVFPWFRFVFAEGNDSEVTIYFATHNVEVFGYGLGALLKAVALQRIHTMIQPTEKEARFSMRDDEPYGGPGINLMVVKLNSAKEEKTGKERNGDES
jgi:hypothetical protein